MAELECQKVAMDNLCFNVYFSLGTTLQDTDFFKNRLWYIDRVSVFLNRSICG